LQGSFSMKTKLYKLFLVLFVFKDWIFTLFDLIGNNLFKGVF
jgi:hypothetical protein